jgi:hypothetical protein
VIWKQNNEDISHVEDLYAFFINLPAYVTVLEVPPQNVVNNYKDVDTCMFMISLQQISTSDSTLFVIKDTCRLSDMISLDTFRNLLDISLWSSIIWNNAGCIAIPTTASTVIPNSPFTLVSCASPSSFYAGLFSSTVLTTLKSYQPWYDDVINASSIQPSPLSSPGLATLITRETIGETMQRLSDQHILIIQTTQPLMILNTTQEEVNASLSSIQENAATSGDNTTPEDNTAISVDNTTSTNEEPLTNPSLTAVYDPTTAQIIMMSWWFWLVIFLLLIILLLLILFGYRNKL